MCHEHPTGFLPHLGLNFLQPYHFFSLLIHCAFLHALLSALDVLLKCLIKCCSAVGLGSLISCQHVHVGIISCAKQ